MLAPFAIWIESARLGRVLAPGDGLTYYLPVHALAARMWRQGVVPGWDPWSFGGSPLLATAQVGALYPPNLVHLLLSPAAAHDLLVVTAFAVAGTGAGLLGRHLTGDGVAGAVCGVTFGLSGFCFGHLNHLSLLATAAWLPWSLWTLERYLARPSAVRLLVAGVPVAAAALAGHPQLLVVVLAVTALWGVGVAVGCRSARPALLTVAPLAVGLLLGAVQLLPVAVHVSGSDRASLGFEEAMSFSFSPSSLPLVVFPHLFGSVSGTGTGSGPFRAPYTGEWSLTELSGYVGAAAVVLAVLGLPPAGHRRRLPAVALVAVASALVALGDSTPFGRLVHALPVVGQMRSWGRATIGLDLAVAVLAAYGAGAVRRGDADRRAAGLAAMAVALLAAAAWSLPQRAPAGHAAWAVGLPLAAAVLAALATRLPRRAAGPVLVALVTLDMFVSFGWWHRWRSASPTTAHVAAAIDPGTPPAWGPVPDAPGGIDRVAFAFGDPLRAGADIPRATSAKGIRTVGGYDPLAPASYLAVTGLSYRGVLDPSSPLLDPAAPLADLLRVTWVVTGDLEGRPRPAALPEAFLVGQARPATPAEAASAARGEVAFDPSAMAFVERCDRCLLADRPGRAGTVGPVRWGPASVEVPVEAERHGVLVLSQAWAPGWSAEVGGEAAPVVRVDGVVQGVPVPPGRHVVALRYETPGLRAGAAVSALTLVALSGAIVVTSRLGRPRRWLRWRRGDAGSGPTGAGR